jgi:hypothetical protein
MAIDPNNTTTVRLDELPPAPLSLTDLFPHQVGTDLKTATLQDLVNFISIHSSALQYEIKRMNVDQTYIDNNFDVTGLGINLCEGFAICNGQNGTTEMDGLSGVGYGAVFNTVGGFGGYPNSTLPAHNHTAGLPSNTGGTAGSGGIQYNGANNNTVTITTTTTGSDATGKNYHPHIIQLYMMKL